MTQKRIKESVEARLKSRLEALGIKPNSKKGLQHQAEFLVGAMAAIEAIYPNKEKDKMSEYSPVIWPLNIMSGRSTIE